MNQLRETAYNWHGGGGSAFYAFASTGGVVWSDKHREDLMAEVKENIDWCLANPKTEEAKDLPRLRKLQAHVEFAPIGEPLETSRGNSLTKPQRWLLGWVRRQDTEVCVGIYHKDAYLGSTIGTRLSRKVVDRLIELHQLTEQKRDSGCIYYVATDRICQCGCGGMKPPPGHGGETAE